MSLGVVVVQLPTMLPLLIQIFILFPCSAEKKFQNLELGRFDFNSHLWKAFPVHELRWVCSFSCCETMNYEITAIWKKEKINGFEFAFLFLLAPLCSFFLLLLSPACLLLKEAEKNEAKKKIISRHSQYLSFCAFASSSRSLAVRGQNNKQYWNSVYNKSSKKKNFIRNEENLINFWASQRGRSRC